MEIKIYSAILLIVVLLFVAITDARFKQRQVAFVSMVCLVPVAVAVLERLTDLWVAIGAMVVIVVAIIGTRKKSESAT